jgi:hypothetical protein
MNFWLYLFLDQHIKLRTLPGMMRLRQKQEDRSDMWDTFVENGTITISIIIIHASSTVLHFIK